MVDLIISAPAVQTAPAGYQVPPAQEIRVKSVRAVIDGTAAAQPFLPTLQLIAPSGQVVWESATDNTVAAAGSADVSWFPRVRGGGTAGTFPNSTYQTAVLADHPIGYWPMHETVPAIFHDISGHGHHTSTAGNGVQIGVTGLIPTSSDLAASYATTPTVMDTVASIPYVTNAFTVEGWVNVVATAGGSCIMSAGNAGSPQFILFNFYLILGVLHCYIIDNTFAQHDAFGSGSVADGQTHYVVATYDGATLTLYNNAAVNGVPLAVAVTLNLNTYDTGLGFPANFLGGTPFNGTLDELALYDYALTQAQITTHYLAATTLV